MKGKSLDTDRKERERENILKMDLVRFYGFWRKKYADVYCICTIVTIVYVQHVIIMQTTVLHYISSQAYIAQSGPKK